LFGLLLFVSVHTQIVMRAHILQHLSGVNVRFTKKT